MFFLEDLKYNKLYSNRKQFNIPCGIHAPHSAAGLNLANVTNRIENKAKITEAIKFADDLKAKYIIFHSGNLPMRRHFADPINITIFVRIIFFQVSSPHI